MDISSLGQMSRFIGSRSRAGGCNPLSHNPNHVRGTALKEGHRGFRELCNESDSTASLAHTTIDTSQPKGFAVFRCGLPLVASPPENFTEILWMRALSCQHVTLINQQWPYTKSSFMDHALRVIVHDPLEILLKVLLLNFKVLL